MADSFLLLAASFVRMKCEANPLTRKVSITVGAGHAREQKYNRCIICAEEGRRAEQAVRAPQRPGLRQHHRAYRGSPAGRRQCGRRRPCGRCTARESAGVHDHAYMIVALEEAFKR
jgi:hypothetical protein